MESLLFKDLIFYILFRYYSRACYFTARYCGEVGKYLVVSGKGEIKTTVVELARNIKPFDFEFASSN